MGLSFGSTTMSVGLDIGTDHIRVAQVVPRGASFALTGYGMIGIPMGAVADGEIVDTEAVSTAIRELWRRAGIKTKNVVIGVSNQKVVVRLIDMQYMAAKSR